MDKEYEDLLRKLGLYHLKDDNEALREAVLKELGMSDLKDDHGALIERIGRRIEDNAERLSKINKELGEIIQKDIMRSDN